VDEAEQLVRDAFARWNAGERETLSDLVGPQSEIRSALTGGRWRGEEGLRRWFAEIDEQFQEWTVEISSLEERAPGRFFGEGEIHARGRHSSMDLAQPVSWVIEVRDGLIVRFENYLGDERTNLQDRVDTDPAAGRG
jgi:ketosteroid isomerase-like protein